jgi:hypothetical protein
MEIKLKDEYINVLIYLPVENRDVLGKFIDKELYPYLYKKYPEFFEIKAPITKKTKEVNDISINDTKSIGGSDAIRKDK